MNTSIFKLTPFILFTLFIFSCGSDEVDENVTSEPIELQVKTDSIIPVDTLAIEQKEVKEVKKEAPASKATTTKAPAKKEEEVIEEKSKTEAKPAVEVEKTKPAKTFFDKGEYINKAIGTSVPKNTKGELTSDAASEVMLKREGECGGAECGKMVYLFNMNPSKKIEAIVEISIKEGKEKSIQKRKYQLKKGSVEVIGCTADCSQTVKKTVKWKIIGTTYID